MIAARAWVVTFCTGLMLAGCGDGDQGISSVSPDEVLRRGPYMGVSCPTPNSFECDRVGLAVWLREPAVSVTSSIAGREFALDDPEWSDPTPRDGQRRMFAGFLQPAGLIDGPMRLTSDGGRYRWYGREPVSRTVDLSIVGDDGSTQTTRLEVGLSAGWG